FVVFFLVVIIGISFAVAFVFLFFLVWLLSEEDIGSYRAIRRHWVEGSWTYSAHAQTVRRVLLGNDRAQ
ncbi:MAG TPA: hypothetical protein VGV15_09790, partial [Terriglobales bacterium]|nr:hypothetical protein [Terriglobales bacterium]